MGNKKSKIITLNEGEHVNIKKKYGKIYTEDDTSYLGDLNKDFEQNGHGIEYDENANIIYEGEWENGVKHGPGKMYFENGDKYLGNLKYGVIDGQGEYHYTNGQFYVGDLKTNNISGFGTLYDSVGSTMYCGMWLNGAFEGWGIYYQENVAIFIGYWHKGLANGFGIMIHNDKVIEIGNYKNGEFDTPKHINMINKMHIEKLIKFQSRLNYEKLNELINKLSKIVNKEDNTLQTDSNNYLQYEAFGYAPPNYNNNQIYAVPPPRIPLRPVAYAPQILPAVPPPPPPPRMPSAPV